MKTLMIHIATAAILVVQIPTALRAQALQELVQPPRGMNGAEYHRLAREAERLWEQGDTAGALVRFERLTESVPWSGDKWAWLGYVRYHAGEHRAAADAFRVANRMGVVPAPQIYALYIARAHARAGEPDSALVWLERTLSEFRHENRSALSGDPAFAGLREHPRFRQLVSPTPPSTVTRDEGWRGDLEYLLQEIRRLNPVYSRQPLPDTLVRAAERLRQHIPRLSDAQIYVEMLHLLTLLGQTHNGIYPWVRESRAKITQLPVQLYVFPEGLYVVSADSAYHDLIGARVLRFDSTPADQALQAMGRIEPRENEAELLWRGPDAVVMPQVLHALGLTRDPDRVVLTIVDRNGRTRRVAPNPVPLRARRKLYAPPIPGLASPPLYLRRPDSVFWFEHLPEEELVYVQVNNMINTREETLARFGLRLRAFLRDHPEVKNLVVDVRRNNGGNTHLYSELLRTLIAFDAEEGNRLFIVIGRNTFSAASNFITDADRLTDALFVGEVSGGKPLMVGGDEAPTILPYSGLRASLASTSWQLTAPRDTRLWIAPDVPVSLTAADYLANRDPVLETVREMVRRDDGGSRAFRDNAVYPSRSSPGGGRDRSLGLNRRCLMNRQEGPDIVW